eukprot:TRINITY_DN15132_c0_g1_i1.p1 TRINITY_DN15132_c0_g1~~TRINITY_DN15132_c0_g1_i1.p1  ORF type:complete len:147 (+),score=48.13 TRINITY_DN15132_c0_g1_i1:127-567(+)
MCIRDRARAHQHENREGDDVGAHCHCSLLCSLGDNCKQSGGFPEPQEQLSISRGCPINSWVVHQRSGNESGHLLCLGPPSRATGAVAAGFQTGDRKLPAAPTTCLSCSVLSVAWQHCWGPVSYTHLRAHETVLDLVCRLLLEKKKN